MNRSGAPRAPRIAVTPGEPAGIGPDLVVGLAAQLADPARLGAEFVVVADPGLLAERAQALGLALELVLVDALDAPAPEAAALMVHPVGLRRPARPGRLDPGNAAYVIETLATAADACADGRCAALVTAPVHKGVINDAGIAFSGHTEFLAARVGGDPVMMLATDRLRVALATTHLPLAQVPTAIDRPLLERVLRILDRDLRERFGVQRPRILVAGLNPHAGEGGHLGREEIDVIEPVLAALREQGLDLRGPLPADTLFTPAQLAGADAVLAMYHDQGLPVLKHAGFGESVNITLGLPILRTSVDHGTALELAATGRADDSSLLAAIQMAVRLVRATPS